jgi:hypothetical protein
MPIVGAGQRILLAGLGKRAEAEAACRQALAIREKLASEYPAVPQYRLELVGSHNSLGVLLSGLGLPVRPIPSCIAC